MQFITYLPILCLGISVFELNFIIELVCNWRNTLYIVCTLMTPAYIHFIFVAGAGGLKNE